MTLDMLSPGERALVRFINDDILTRRLLALGFAAGGEVKCAFAAPCGDPVAYEYGSLCVALRRRDAAKVELWD